MNQNYQLFEKSSVVSKELRQGVSRRWISWKKIIYLPHHSVYHPNKSGKMRVVFEFKKACLNRELLSEPENRCPSEVQIKAHCCDVIEAMFHQVKVLDDQCRFLRFLCWERKDTSREAVDYEMMSQRVKMSRKVRELHKKGGFNLT